MLNLFVAYLLVNLLRFFACLLFISPIITANCVLPTMYEGEAYISVSFLLPPFFSQSVTL